MLQFLSALKAIFHNIMDSLDEYIIYICMEPKDALQLASSGHVSGEILILQEIIGPAQL